MSPNRPLVGKRSLTGVSDNHPDNGSRRDRSQPIVREPVKQCVREGMGKHVCHCAADLVVSCAG
jgi:hypothetical protein